MISARCFAAALCAVVLFPGFVSAQDTRVPAELPPASFDGAQYVDSRGCIFVRVELNGTVTWVPRLTRSRQQICQAPQTQVAAAEPVEVIPATQAPARVRTAPIPQAARPMPAPAARKPVVAAPVVVASSKPAMGASPVESTTLPGSTRVVPLHVAQSRVRVGDFTVPKGYRPAWKDDRLNPHRAEGTLAGRDQMNLIWTSTLPRRLIDPSNGRDVTAKVALVYPYTTFELQRRELGKVTLATRNGKIVKRIERNKMAPKAHVSSRSAAAQPERLAGQRYVQAGKYDTSRAAQVHAARLKDLGLPVRIGKYEENRRLVRLVLAGPFASDKAARAALQQVRAAGFGEAFLRK